MENSSKIFKKCLLIICFTFGISLFCATDANAQLNPLAGIYFDNEYLANPAMAGVVKGINVNMGYRLPWSTIPGAPKTQALTAEYGTSKKVGLGLAIYNDEAGLIKRTRVMSTYSYQLPLNDSTKKLCFGLSLGFMNDRISNEDINGDQDDANVNNFNQRETYIDGDFGIAYISDKLSLQLAIPNTKSFFKKEKEFDTSDYSTFYSAVSYRFYFPTTLNGFEVEPKIALRGIHGFNNLIDVGAKCTIGNNAASAMAIYHSSQSITFGVGTSVKSFGSINANYTTPSVALSQYSNGNFQIGVKLNLMQKGSVN